MFPILYEGIELDTTIPSEPRFIVPEDYGLGVLADCISCVVEQERNGKYELIMEYPLSGIHAQDLAQRRVIKVKPNFIDDPQLFRIDRIGAVINGKFTVYGKHISYDLSGFIIKEGVAINAAKACELFTDAAPGYYIHTGKTTIADFSITTPGSVRSYFAGKQGSFLDVFGTAEIKIDNFDINFMTDAGEDRGVTIRYGKNLLELSQEMQSENLYTHVCCYYKNGEDPSITGDNIPTGLVLDVNKVLILDVTSEYQEAPNKLQLNARAQQYINNNTNSLTVPSNNITLNFIQSGELANRVDLCDTVTIYYEALGISRAKVKCIRTKWDCLRGKYIETEFGDVKQDLSDTIAENTAAVGQAVNGAETALNLVASKKRVFISEPVPPYDIGDLWAENGVIYKCVTPKTATIIKEAEGSVVSFEALITADLIECVCEIEPDPEGYSVVIISVADEEMEVQKVYAVELGETLTQGGSLNVITGLLTRSDTTTKQLDIPETNIPETIVGVNNISCNTGSMALMYYETGFSKTDWELATDYVDDDVLKAEINRSSQLITGGLGGNVVIQRTPINEDGTGGVPYEIVIFKTENPTDPQDLEHAKYVWRWNSGGLAYSDSGYDSQNYKLALDSEGHINASMITTGNLNAIQAGIQNLTASMFEGQMIQLGGPDMPNGKIVILDQEDNPLINIDIDGLECFGEPVNGVTPSVVFNKFGVTGYSNKDDKENSAIFWTKEQDFHMSNAVIENQMDIGGMLKFLPFEIKNSSNVITNQGIAVVANT